MNQAERSVLIKNNVVNWAPADAILVAALLFPDEIILGEQYYHSAEVELKGDRTRGQLILNGVLPDCEEHNIVRVVKLTNTDVFKTIILAAANNTLL